jgi:hypothetical protein
MFIPYCDESIDFIYVTLIYNVFCGGNKQVCDFNELVYGPRCHWSEDLEILLSLDFITTRIYSISVLSQLDRGWCPQSLVMATFVLALLVRTMHG